MRAHNIATTTPPPPPPQPFPQWSSARTVVAALLVGGSYFIGAKLGLELTFQPHPVSTLWPPNAILLAALVLAPTRVWWILLAAALPAHVAVELQGGVPIAMVLSWFVSNCTEALIGAYLIRRFVPGPARLDSVRGLALFVLFATFLATFLSSFLDADLVALNRWGEAGYWDVWRMRFLSNVLAVQTLVPVILETGPATVHAIRRAPLVRDFEAGFLGAGLLTVCIIAFISPHAVARVGPALLYAPLPLLVWAAVRFGSYGVSICLAIVTGFAIWGTVHGNGPFTALSPSDNALSVQLFLILISLPLAALSALIAERSRAEEDLRNSQRIASLAIGAARVGIWSMVNYRTKEFELDEVIAGILGVAPTELGHGAAIHPADRDAVRAHHDAAWAADAPRDAGGDSPIAAHEYRIIRSDGSVRWVLSRGAVLRRPDGVPYRSTGTLMDITDRKRAEVAQRENDERMALAAAAANIGFWTCELDTMQVWKSDECRRIFGVPLDARLTAAQYAAMMHPDDAARINAQWMEAVRTGTPLETEHRIIRPDGEVRHVALSARIERDVPDAPGRMIGVTIDITERRRAEREAGEQRRELAHLARVVTIGELSGAVAHELGQPLTAIMADAQTASHLIKREQIDVAVLGDILQDIVSETRRAGDVIRQLRQLLRKDAPQREVFDVRKLVREGLALAHSDFVEAQISVATSFAPELPPVRGDRVQLQQVLLNLVLNARDALTQVAVGMRRLSVEVSRMDADRVRVTVSDSGPGIPEDQLQRIFDPFFTTKPQGLGLGLAICRSIVIDHGGELWAKNAPNGGGAIVFMVLPSVRPGEIGATGGATPPAYQPPPPRPAFRSPGSMSGPDEDAAETH